MQRAATRVREAAHIITYASDRFNRADGAPGTAASGQAWTTSNFVIASGALKPSSNIDGSTCTLALPAGVNDVVISAVIAGTGSQPGIIGRVTGDTFYLVNIHNLPDDPAATLYKCVSGSFTSLGSSAVPVISGDNLALSMKGTAIKVLLNGAAIVTMTDADIPSGTGCGFRHGNAELAPLAYTWDNFLVVRS